MGVGYLICNYNIYLNLGGIDCRLELTYENVNKQIYIDVKY